MMSTIARALPTIALLVVVFACREVVDEVPRSGSQVPDDFVPGAVTRTDADLWRHRQNKKRGVRVTIGIPAETDSVVIRREAAEVPPDRDSVQFVEVNSVRVLAPSKLQRIVVRSADGDAMRIELMVELGHCRRLDLVATTYWRVGQVDSMVERLPQKHKLPDCCVVPSSAGEAVNAADAPKANPTLPSHARADGAVAGRGRFHD